MIENTIPIINVADLSTSLDFYRNTLGFSTDWEAEVDADKIAGISRDGCAIYLCEGSEGAKGSWLWIGVESADYFDQVIASGATIVQEATNYPWAYELRVQDPDGNVIRIGTGPI
jgi:predicted enzyme related to lactoylglutathione lyase